MPNAPAPTAVDPKFVVDDSPAKAATITAISLIFFGITLAGALLKLLSAHDLNGIRALLMRDDVVGWLTVVAPLAWGAFRTFRSWVKKVRDVEIVNAADDTVAMTRTALDRVQSVFAASRAREATTATRLVDASVLHRGGVVPAPATAAAADDQAAFDADRDRVLNLIEPHIPGDALSPQPEGDKA